MRTYETIHRRLLRLLAFTVGWLLSLSAWADHFSLHPDNPRYFRFRGEPTILIASAEHYGALLNLDFDYTTYFEELAAHGLNNTRVFSGTYVEPQGAFNIARNTLAPAPHRFIAPWVRSSTPGYANGGNKFDLTQWNEDYFTRLKDLVAEAGKQGDFDNLVYEVCNEPYFGGVTQAWQNRITDVIVDAQRNHPRKHLISHNVANGAAKVSNPHPAVSLFNFHYASPPDAVALNAHLNKAIGDNETGFRGTHDFPYRKEAWDFILAGGALFNHLDYSFTVGHERGTFEFPPTQPGGGGRAFRRQMRTLKEFMHSFEFLRMKPSTSVVRGGLPDGFGARVLAEAGHAYAIYVSPAVQPKNYAPDPKRAARSFALELDLPQGAYAAQWLHPESGKIERREVIRSAGRVVINSPEFQEDLALRIKRDASAELFWGGGVSLSAADKQRFSSGSQAFRSGDLRHHAGRAADPENAPLLRGGQPGRAPPPAAASGPAGFPRTILFRVGGTIELVGELQIAHPFVTVAGQSAPGDGILIRNAGLAVMAHDVLVRHLRIRPGDRGRINPEVNDALSILNPGHGRDPRRVPDARGAPDVHLAHGVPVRLHRHARLDAPDAAGVRPAPYRMLRLDLRSAPS